MTISVILSRPADALYRLRRWRHRAGRPACPLCGDEMQEQVQDLLRQGFYRAAITAARLRLELVAVEYYQRSLVHVVGDSVPRKRIGIKWVLDELEDIGEIDHLLRNRMRRLYIKSSRVVHGAICTRAMAKSIVIDTEATIKLLKGGAS